MARTRISRACRDHRDMKFWVEITEDLQHRGQHRFIASILGAVVARYDNPSLHQSALLSFLPALAMIACQSSTKIIATAPMPAPRTRPPMPRMNDM